MAPRSGSGQPAGGDGPLIAVVGPCAAGKSLLVASLRERGYNAREVVQEHSLVASMWQQITRSDWLIYLDVSAPVALRRRAGYADPRWWEELARRLAHAREHADLYLLTDGLTPAEVLEQVLAFLHRVCPRADPSGVTE